jgi:hypothetical protein
MQIAPVLLIVEQKFFLDLRGYFEIFAVFQNFIYLYIFIYLFIYLSIYLFIYSTMYCGFLFKKKQYREKGTIN